MNRNKNYTKQGSNYKPDNKGRGKGGKPQRGNKPKNVSDTIESDIKSGKPFFEKKTGNPSVIYFTDRQLAEQNCSVSSRSVLHTGSPISGTDKFYPNIITYHMNPSVQVSPWSWSESERKASALSISALKLRTAIAANTGRIVSYQGIDILTLLIEIGEYISMTEFGRRCFGLLFKYADLNRDIPKQLIEACGIDVDDFINNRAHYLSEFNFYINLGSQIVIPKSKIPYFDKCEQLYQKVYKDGTDDLTCYHMFVPHSTWLLNETYQTGTRLVTKSVTGEHITSNGCGLRPTNTTSGSRTAGLSNIQPHAIWTFQEFLDEVYKPLVVGLLDSAVFNNIYSDLRSSKFQAAYGFDFWKAELVDEHYSVEFVDDPTMLSIFHNLDVIGAPIIPQDETTAQGAVMVTAANDVVPDPTTDTLIYNPAFLDLFSAALDMTKFIQPGATLSNLIYYRDRSRKIFDFKSFDPSLDERVDAMAYSVAQLPDDRQEIIPAYNEFLYHCNYILPDHYCTGRYTYLAAYEAFSVNEYGTAIDDETKAKWAQISNHWFPMSYNNMIVRPLYPLLSQNAYKFSDNEHYVAAHEVTAVSDLNNTYYMPYVNEITIGVDGTRTIAPSDPSIPSKVIYESFSNCDINNFYSVDATKMYDMMNHVYQTLFTAEGIIK